MINADTGNPDNYITAKFLAFPVWPCHHLSCFFDMALTPKSTGKKGKGRARSTTPSNSNDPPSPSKPCKPKSATRQKAHSDRDGSEPGSPGSTPSAPAPSAPDPGPSAKVWPTLRRHFASITNPGLDASSSSARPSLSTLSDMLDKHLGLTIGHKTGMSSSSGASASASSGMVDGHLGSTLRESERSVRETTNRTNAALAL